MYSALHDCGHASRWNDSTSAPGPGEQVTCFHCGAATRVNKLVGPYRVKCLSCRRVDSTYVAEQTTVAVATCHLQEWSTHRVRLWQWGDPQSVRVWTSDETGVQPPLLSDAPF